MAANTDQQTLPSLPPQPKYVGPNAFGVGFQTNPQFGGAGPVISVTGVPTQNLGVVPSSNRPT